MFFVLRFLFIAEIIGQTMLVCETKQSCSCAARICPSTKNCQKVIRDECGCCLVCKRRKYEICGGNEGMFGRCAENLQCDFGMTQRNAFANVGLCVEKERSTHITECFDTNASNGGIRRRIGDSWFSGCLKMTCTKTGKIHTKKATCTEMSCGTTRSYKDNCCRHCKRESPRIICGRSSMQLIIPKSFMSESLFSKSTLINARCAGYKNNTHFYFITSFDGCGTELVKSEEEYRYINKVMIPMGGNEDIKRTFFSFFCARKKYFQFQQAFRIRQSTKRSGITMQIASPEGRLYPRKKSKVVGVNENMDISISSVIFKRYPIRIMLSLCILTEQKRVTSNSQAKYVIFRNGCAVDKNVKIKLKRKDVIWFSITNRDFWKQFHKLYLHCDITICPEFKFEGKCGPRECNKRLLKNNQ